MAMTSRHDVDEFTENDKNGDESSRTPEELIYAGILIVEKACQSRNTENLHDMHNIEPSVIRKESSKSSTTQLSRRAALRENSK